MIVDEKIKTIWLHNPKCGGLFFRRIYNETRKDGLENIYNGVYTEDRNTDLAHIDYSSLARFIPDYHSYKIIAFIRNPYNRFVSGWKTSCERIRDIQDLNKKLNGNTKDICEYINGLNYYQQDQLLRNRKIPWLNPQTNYTRGNTILLKFESVPDWSFLLRVFQISNAHIRIPEDYSLDAETKDIIRSLYYDDEKIFRYYENN